MPTNPDKVALVTGASKGLGADIARALGHAGYHVIIAFHNDKTGAEAVASSIRSTSRIASLDVSDRAQASALLEDIKTREARLDIVVNNAGITANSLMARTTEDDWHQVFAVNLTGTHNITLASHPLLTATGGGHIVNISSRSGLIGKAGQAAYSASKSAILGLTTTMARKLATDNIRVNAIVPGYMPTPMGLEAESAMERAKADSLLGGLADTKEAASFIVWLASTRKITGQIFSLDSRLQEAQPW